MYWKRSCKVTTMVLIPHCSSDTGARDGEKAERGEHNERLRRFWLVQKRYVVVISIQHAGIAENSSMSNPSNLLLRDTCVAMEPNLLYSPFTVHIHEMRTGRRRARNPRKDKERRRRRCPEAYARRRMPGGGCPEAHDVAAAVSWNETRQGAERQKVMSRWPVPQHHAEVAATTWTKFTAAATPRWKCRDVMPVWKCWICHLVHCHTPQGILM